MPQNRIELTPEGHAKLKEELELLEGEKAKEITEAIRRARDYGDLSENAEYDAARDEQSKNMARISEIKAMLANAVVVEATDDVSNVGLGCTVTLADEKGQNASFTIVGTTETNSLEHRISNESPMGSAVMGHAVGDACEVCTPSGATRTYTIVSIER